jgi:hypothetical protein
MTESEIFDDIDPQDPLAEKVWLSIKLACLLGLHDHGAAADGPVAEPSNVVPLS